MKVLAQHEAGRVFPGRSFLLFSRYPVTILLVVVSMLLSLVPELASRATWRSTTPIGIPVYLAHFTHWSIGHLIWDLLTFAILAGMLEKINRRVLWHALVWMPPVIIAMTWLAGIHSTYRGLSGLDCGLYAALLTVLLKQGRINLFLSVFALALVFVKSSYELISGNTVLVSDLPAGVTGVPVAHLAGALAGLALTMLIYKTQTDSIMKPSRKTVTLIFAILLSMAGILLAGCDSKEINSVTRELAGEYALIEVEGHPMPAQLVHGGIRMEVLGGSLSFFEDGTCKSITRFKPESGSEIRREVDATCTQEGNRITMHWTGAGTTSGTLDSRKFTMNNEGMLFIYVKKE